ncbi:MAG: GAF domain-containing protein, partial [Thermodesulfovibrionia bacterium]|nr:GAF domain-containing protein [Thermodesulfovibrionia bacterium]
MGKDYQDIINKLNYRESELTTLYEIAKRLGTSLDPVVIVGSILEILSENMGMQRGTLALLDPETKQLHIEVGHGLTTEEKGRGVYKIGEGVTGKVVETGEPVIVPDVGKEPLFLNRTRARGDISRENISFICVPLKVKGDTIGVLSIDRTLTDKGVSLDEDVRVLTIVASLIGQAINISKVVELERKNFTREKMNLQRELKSPYRFANIVYQSEKMREVLEAAWRVSQSK